MILCLIAIDALLPIYSIKRNIRWGLKIHVVIGGITLLADALLRGFSVLEKNQWSTDNFFIFYFFIQSSSKPDMASSSGSMPDKIARVLQGSTNPMTLQEILNILFFQHPELRCDPKKSKEHVQRSLRTSARFVEHTTFNYTLGPGNHCG